MLNQAAGDRQILAKQLNISKEQLSHVTSSNEGEGLLFYGNIIIPFRDRFDKSLKIYSYLTTKPEEVERRKKAEEAMRRQQIAESRGQMEPDTYEAAENSGKHFAKNYKQPEPSTNAVEVWQMIEEANEELQRLGGM